MVRTIRLLIAYDGGNYCGWQRQKQGEATIQGEMERRLALLCQEEITLHGAGRTDTGVHAQGMVAHFQTSARTPVTAFFKGLNSLLPPDIRILGAEEAPPDFHSRFDAQGKTYRYDFFTGPLQAPWSRLYRAHFPGPFDPDRLRLALNCLQGTHDFSSFERTGTRDKTLTTGRGAVRTLHDLSCSPSPGGEACWSIRITGDGFLRQMVRILSGTLIEIGQGKRDDSEMERILEARDRRMAGLTAPACGLYLERLYYPKPLFQEFPNPCFLPS
ncbi:tRNA pseudouridine(38-40) synthase TruA [Desulfobulbus rhabdoformis]|uniref:tRNA pseudouridine(38-40) synthase TruA n=1 Tax=Desulfobulbus rhabdoformis TaxID=34032 RepID=UPI001963980C|nr:tRNA pseudouridine(38-40) synthase TruA [Desulfobulbus rhabdoformis]MBM9616218.1 tRNA pseudouridine(38-40) synthase TruA [Desulfobulbus rhabdoformis]